jgi:chorismate synthase
MSPLRFLTAGESHGPALLATLEGLPAGLSLTEDIINQELSRRQRGFGSGERMTIENDQCELLSGVMAGRTTGGPIGIKIDNMDHINWKGKASPARTIPRPGHVDLAAAIKYGYNDLRPGFERASARETAARVAIGGICQHFLSQFNVQIGGYVLSIGSVEARLSQSEKNDLRCPDLNAVEKMQETILQAKEAGETLGGKIEVLCLNVPPGLGSHVHWDRKLDGQFAQAVMSIPAIKGFEIGPAFEKTQEVGTAVQDPIQLKGQQITQGQNAAGGLEGGITNGQPILIRAAMKPIPTTLKAQMSVDLASGEPQRVQYERSDVCPVPRAVVVVEAMAAYVLARVMLEKLGGDTMAELLKRFKDFPKSTLDEFHLSVENKVWW